MVFESKCQRTLESKVGAVMSPALTQSLGTGKSAPFYSLLNALSFVNTSPPLSNTQIYMHYAFVSQNPLTPPLFTKITCSTTNAQHTTRVGGHYLGLVKMAKNFNIIRYYDVRDCIILHFFN